MPRRQHWQLSLVVGYLQVLFHSSSHDPDRPSREDSRTANDLDGHQALHLSRLEFILGFFDKILPGGLPVCTGWGSKPSRPHSS
ncbi:MAG: hypothetical protein ACK55Z_04455, partial [bacterium]